MLGTVHKRKLFNTRVTTKNSRSQRTGRVYPPRSTGGHVRERVEAVEDVSRMVAEQAMTRVRVRTEHISVGGPIPHSFPSLTRQASWIWTHHGKWQFRCSGCCALQNQQIRRVNILYLATLQPGLEEGSASATSTYLILILVKYRVGSREAKIMIRSSHLLASSCQRPPSLKLIGIHRHQLAFAYGLATDPSSFGHRGTL